VPKIECTSLSDQDNFKEQLIQRIRSYDQTGASLTNIIIDSGLERSDCYAVLNECVVSGFLLKADIYFAFGELASEFEFILSKVGGNSAFMTTAEIVKHVDNQGLLGPFNKNDFAQYLNFRNCVSELINLVAEIERTTWFIIFDLIFQKYGENWLAFIDVQKRKNWATMREDFRVTGGELPLQQFSSLADLRDIVLDKKNWPMFSEHLPKELADKSVYKSTFNKILIPIRNRLFHPTRELSLSFNEYLELRSLRETMDAKAWRNLDAERMTVLSLAAPPPNWF
jgi:hypothetical protein